MNIKIFLFLTWSFALGHVLVDRSSNLAARDEQSLTNPDEDPEFVDGATGTKVPKSRVLKGVGPSEANDRYFDWDESCSGEEYRTRIYRAFLTVRQIAEATSAGLGSLKDSLPSGSKEERTKFIFENDPAFGQMFLGLDENIDYIKESFDILVKNAHQAPNDRGGGKPGALRFICDPEGKVKQGNDASQSYCGTGETGAQAIMTLPYDPKFKPTIEARYSFEKSSSIVFCPPFFDSFGHFEDILLEGESTLDKVDSVERILLHEYMHLPWVRNMKAAPDYIGWYQAAEYALKGKWGNIKVNPDNYAWYALYSYLNNEGEGCGIDAWPEGTEKLNQP